MDIEIVLKYAKLKIGPCRKNQKFSAYRRLVVGDKLTVGLWDLHRPESQDPCLGNLKSDNNQ